MTSFSFKSLISINKVNNNLSVGAVRYSQVLGAGKYLIKLKTLKRKLNKPRGYWVAHSAVNRSTINILGLPGLHYAAGLHFDPIHSVLA